MVLCADIEDMELVADKALAMQVDATAVVRLPIARDLPRPLPDSVLSLQPAFTRVDMAPGARPSRPVLLQWAYVAAWGSDAPQPRWGAAKAVRGQAKQGATLVRWTVPRAFCASGASGDVVAGAPQAIHDWCVEHDRSLKAQLVSVWKSRHEATVAGTDPRAHGLLCVHSAALPTILGLSGKPANCMVVVCEPFRRSPDQAPDPFDQPPIREYVKRQKDEQVLVYAARAYDMAGDMGLGLGEREFCTRRRPIPGVARSATWFFEPAPSHWSSRCVQLAMEQAGFLDPEAEGRPTPCRGGMRWRVRAKTAGPALDYETVTHDKATITITKAPPPQPRQRVTHDLKPRHAHWRAAGDSSQSPAAPQRPPRSPARTDDGTADHAAACPLARQTSFPDDVRWRAAADGDDSDISVPDTDDERDDPATALEPPA